MLTSILLPVLFVSNLNAGFSDEIKTAESPNLLKKSAERGLVLLAKGREAPGPIHDENHDGDLPANKHKGDGYPSTDPYDGSTDNNRGNPNKPY